jgi:hypothetical protein
MNQRPPAGAFPYVNSFNQVIEVIEPVQLPVDLPLQLGRVQAKIQLFEFPGPFPATTGPTRSPDDMVSRPGLCSSAAPPSEPSF